MRLASSQPLVAIVLAIVLLGSSTHTAASQTLSQVPTVDIESSGDATTSDYTEFDEPIRLAGTSSFHTPVSARRRSDSKVTVAFNTSSAVVGQPFQADLVFDNTQTTNGGPFDISSVTFTYTHDASWTVDSWSQTFTAGFNAFESCESGTTTFTCTAITFPRGESQTFSLVINPTQAGTFTSTLTSTQNEVDPNTADNTTSKSLTVTALGAISGTIFEDNNGNGQYDTSGINPETGSTAGGTVFIDADASGGQSSGDPTATVNGATGFFQFLNLTPGTYSVNYQPSSPWQRIDTGDPFTVPVTGGNTTTVNFGVFRDGTLSGFACNDGNGNQTCDAGEAPAGTKVGVDTDRSGGFNGTEAFVTFRGKLRRLLLCDLLRRGPGQQSE